MNKYIIIQGQKYRIREQYTKGKNSYIVYDRVKPSHWSEYTRTYLKDRVIKNGNLKCVREKFNLWNPLTYVLFIVNIIICFVVGGVNEIKDNIPSYFRENIYGSYVYKKGDIEYGD